MTMHVHNDVLIFHSHKQRTTFMSFIAACVLSVVSLAITQTASGQCSPVEAFKLTASDAAALDGFGTSVAISGPPGNPSNTTGTLSTMILLESRSSSFGIVLKAVMLVRDRSVLIPDKGQRQKV